MHTAKSNLYKSPIARLWFTWTRGIALVALLVTSLSGAYAQDADVPPGLAKDASSSYFSPSPGIGIKQATAIVRESIGGRVLSASPRQVGQHMQYRVRVLVDGERVITVTVDQNGRILRRR